MVEKYIETLPFTASVFVVALTIVAVLVAVFLLFMRLLDDHPIVFVIVMVVPNPLQEGNQTTHRHDSTVTASKEVA